jgi:hypothetical protein
LSRLRKVDYYYQCLKVICDDADEADSCDDDDGEQYLRAVVEQ